MKKKSKKKRDKTIKQVEKDVKKVKRRVIKTAIGLTPLFVVIIFIAFTILVVKDVGAVYGDNAVLGAHRGNSLDYMENTIPAFQSALIKTLNDPGIQKLTKFQNKEYNG